MPKASTALAVASLLCAGCELSSSFASVCATLQGEGAHTSPTFGLALATLPDPHWNALTPNAPLRRWRLIEVGMGNLLTASPLRIDERVLHYLSGVQYLDEVAVDAFRVVQRFPNPPPGLIQESGTVSLPSPAVE